MTRVQYIGWTVFTLLSCLVAPATGSAEDTKRVAVLSFSGSGSALARNEVVEALSEQSELSLVSSRQVEDAAQKLHASTTTDTGIVDIAGELALSAVVEGEVDKAGKAFRVTLRVRNGATGEVLEERKWTRTRAQLKGLAKAIWPALGGAVTRSQAPARKVSAAAGFPTETRTAPRAEQPPPEADEEQTIAENGGEEPASAESSAPATPRDRSVRHPALTVQAGPRLMWRTLSYDGATTLNPYENRTMTPAVNAAVSAQWFPAAHVRGDFLSDFGIEADLDYSMGLKSKQGTRTFATTAYELSVGALYRLPLKAFEPRFRVGYVKHVYDADLPATVLLPGVSYSAVRMGIGTGIFLGEHVAADVAFAYLAVLDTGELEKPTFAKGTSASALEFGGGVLVRIKDVFGVRLGIDYRRYALDFSSATSATAALPKSGVDSYLRTTLAFVYNLPGVRSTSKLAR